MFVDEKDLLQALQKGDERAMESLFRDHYSRLCNYANILLSDKDESEEVVQQLFVQVWEKKESMEITSSLQAYLFRSLRNSCLNKIKHNKVRRNYAEEVISLSKDSEPASHITYQSELQEQIAMAINGLPEQCRLIFKLSRFENLKYAEIAEQLNISVKTVENQMGKALRVMRERLKDYLILVIILGHYYLYS